MRRRRDPDSPLTRVAQDLPAALGAGLALGVAEIVLARAAGSSASAAVLTALLLGTILLVGVPVAALALLASRAVARRTALVTGAGAAIALAPFALAPAPTTPVRQAFGVSLLLAGVLLAGRIGAALEARSRALPALPVWGVTAALVAAGERHLPGAGDPERISGLTAAGVAGAILLTLVHRALLLAPGARAPSFGAGALGLAVTGALVVAWPSLGPMLALEGGPTLSAAAPSQRAPNLLVCVVPPWALTSEPYYWLDSVAQAAPGARRVRADAARGRALFDDDAHAPLFARLADSGYRTAAFLRSGVREAPRGVALERVATAPFDALREAGRWSAGQPLAVWASRRPALAARLGQRAPGAEPAAAGASRWLLEWRSAGEQRPFALYVDLRDGAAEHPGDLRDVDRALEGLLGTLANLGEDADTVLVLVEPAGEGRGRGEALLRGAAGARGEEDRDQALVRAVVRSLRAAETPARAEDGRSG